MPIFALALLLTIGPAQYGNINLLYAPGGFGSLDGTVPPATCEVVVDVFNTSGKQVATGTFNLTLGQTGTLTFGRGGGVFTQQAMLVNNCPADSMNCDPTLCNISESIETVNSLTLQTQVLQTGFVSRPFIDQLSN
ncbi:MAG TPA: hypothetical protein VMA09_14595 [Candidatus Binataceae bacterium]|nr:hypothetical protein [Candidatus Binataceae bacterium]